MGAVAPRPEGRFGASGPASHSLVLLCRCTAAQREVAVSSAGFFAHQPVWAEQETVRWRGARSAEREERTYLFDCAKRRFVAVAVPLCLLPCLCAIFRHQHHIFARRQRMQGGKDGGCERGARTWRGRGRGEASRERGVRGSAGSRLPVCAALCAVSDARQKAAPWPMPPGAMAWAVKNQQNNILVHVGVWDVWSFDPHIC